MASNRALGGPSLWLFVRPPAVQVLQPAVWEACGGRRVRIVWTSRVPSVLLLSSCINSLDLLAARCVSCGGPRAACAPCCFWGVLWGVWVPAAVQQLTTRVCMCVCVCGMMLGESHVPRSCVLGRQVDLPPRQQPDLGRITVVAMLLVLL